MLPRSAVSGVRSSCEASPTKRRSASRARSSEASMALSVCGQLADLVGGGRRREPPGGVAGGADLARAGGQPGERQQRAAGQHGGQRGPQQRDGQRDEQHSRRVSDTVSSVAVSVAATSTAPPAASLEPSSPSGAA